MGKIIDRLTDYFIDNPSVVIIFRFLGTSVLFIIKLILILILGFIVLDFFNVIEVSHYKDILSLVGKISILVLVSSKFGKLMINQKFK